MLVKVGGKFVAFDEQVVSNGAEIDARKGGVEITTAAGEKAVFYDGIFKVSQSGGITTLTLTEKLDCPQARPGRGGQEAQDAQAVGRREGQVPDQGHLQRRHRPRHQWLVQDTCTSTLTRVTQGVVSVQDFPRKRTIRLRAGKSYTAKRR